MYAGVKWRMCRLLRRAATVCSVLTRLASGSLPYAGDGFTSLGAYTLGRGARLRSYRHSGLSRCPRCEPLRGDRRSYALGWPVRKSKYAVTSECEGVTCMQCPDTKTLRHCVSYPTTTTQSNSRQLADIRSPTRARCRSPSLAL